MQNSSKYLKKNKHCFKVNAKLSFRDVTPVELNEIILKLDADELDY